MSLRAIVNFIKIIVTLIYSYKRRSSIVEQNLYFCIICKFSSDTL